LAQVENLQETIQELEDYGDLDYDGIINALINVQELILE
jgi:hypothetical protein